MKILFTMSSPEYLRYYDGTIAELARRGHHVVLAANFVRDGKPVRFDAMSGAGSRVEVAGLVPPRGDRWTTLARAVRGTMDFVRYLHPDLAQATLLRARVKRQALPSALQWMDAIRSLNARAVSRIMAGLAAAERAIPPAAPLMQFLDRHEPDLVLVSPLVEPASDQVDMVRAAQARGTRVATLVASWDNLTNKGDLRVATGLIAVWNEHQKREAVHLHRVPPASVVVTGAQVFDRWFDRSPSRAREAFCEEVGLPADRPFVLFTGSSIFIARAEVEIPFVRRWIEALRGSADAAVRDLAILVRPHPYNGRAWDPGALAGLRDVAVWPRGGYDPVDERNRAGLFDSLYHSEAVVGINTSAMIEAAIVGRPVLSVETPEFAGTQDGTLHYRHLLPENGGFLRVAGTFEEHIGQLAGILRHPEIVRGELSSFVRSFIRPHGLDRPATPVLADVIERYMAEPAPAPVKTAAASRILRMTMAPLTPAAALLEPPALWKRKGRLRSIRDGAVRRAAAWSGRKASAPRRAEAGARVPRGAFLAAALPVGLATLVVLAFAVLEAAGYAPFSYDQPRNVAEAAGMGRAADVVRMMRRGEDPTRVADVRADIISPSITRVTAVEAAIWSRRIRLLQLLDRAGAIPSARERHRLACIAAAIRMPEMVVYLESEGQPECDGDAAVREIEQRQ